MIPVSNGSVGGGGRRIPNAASDGEAGQALCPTPIREGASPEPEPVPSHRLDEGVCPEGSCSAYLSIADGRPTVLLRECVLNINGTRRSI